MSRVLAFDFGASTGRAILAEYKNGKLSYNEVHRFDNNLVEKDGLLCWDFDYLLNEVKKAIDMCENVDSLAFDTWGVDYGMLDKDGKLISLPVCYRDDRTKNEVSKVFEKMPDKKLYSLTGNQIMAINTLFQLCSEKINNADTFIFMPDLFAYFLCGAKTAEQTIASTSQMLDLENVKWQKEVFNLTGKNESILPPIVKSATQAGEYKGIKVIKVAGHDTQCAVCAMPANPDETPAFLSCGTWSLIGCENDEPILTEKSMNDELSNELGANGKINYGLFRKSGVISKARAKNIHITIWSSLQEEQRLLNFSLTLTTQVLPHRAICLKKFALFAKKRVKASPKATVQ